MRPPSSGFVEAILQASIETDAAPTDPTCSPTDKKKRLTIEQRRAIDRRKLEKTKERELLLSFSTVGPAEMHDTGLTRLAAGEGYDLPIQLKRGSVGGEYSDYPSVTKILDATKSEESRRALEAWRERKTLELGGPEAFAQYQRQLLGRGQRLHNHIEASLLGEEEAEAGEEDAVSRRHVASVNAVLKDFSWPLALESHVVHPALKYKGYMDCVAVYRGRKDGLALIDWKTSERSGKTTLQDTYDAPIQVAAYLGALNRDPRYPFAEANRRISKGLVVLVFADGSPAKVLAMTESLAKKYWLMWLERLSLFRKLQTYGGFGV